MSGRRHLHTRQSRFDGYLREAADLNWAIGMEMLTPLVSDSTAPKLTVSSHTTGQWLSTATVLICSKMAMPRTPQCFSPSAGQSTT